MEKLYRSKALIGQKENRSFAVKYCQYFEMEI